MASFVLKQSVLVFKAKPIVAKHYTLHFQRNPLSWLMANNELYYKIKVNFYYEVWLNIK